MIYAFLVDGLDFEKREEFDRILTKPATDVKSKAERERQAMQALAGIPGVAGGA